MRSLAARSPRSTRRARLSSSAGVSSGVSPMRARKRVNPSVMAATVVPVSQGQAVLGLKGGLRPGAALCGPDAGGGSLTPMTDPLLWLDGDPTDGRTATLDDEPAAAPAPPDHAPVPRRGGRFRSAFAGGIVAAALVGGGALVLSPGSSPVAAISGSQHGNVEAIYAAASASVVTVKTEEGSGTGFAVTPK